MCFCNPRGTNFIGASRDLLLLVLLMLELRYHLIIALRANCFSLVAKHQVNLCLTRLTSTLTKRPFRIPSGTSFACTTLDYLLCALSMRCYLKPAIICRAVTAHSSPLLPRRPPLRSCAWSRVLVVIRPNITGTSYSTFSLDSPAVTPSHI